MPRSDRAPPSPPGSEVEPQVPSKRAVGDKAEVRAKPKVKAAKKRKDKRGTPKGKGTVKPLNGGRIGNPPFVATEEQRLAVEYLTACGWTQAMIGEKLGVSVKALRQHFRAELDEGNDRATARLGGELYQGALAGDAKKLEMWFDRRGGPEWRKKSGVELSGPGGAPIEYRELSDEELEARIAARLSGHAAGAAKA